METTDGQPESDTWVAWVDDKYCRGFRVCEAVLRELNAGLPKESRSKILGWQPVEIKGDGRRVPATVERHVRIRGSDNNLLPPGQENAVEVTGEEAQILIAANRACPSRGSYDWPIHVEPVLSEPVDPLDTNWSD